MTLSRAAYPISLYAKLLKLRKREEVLEADLNKAVVKLSPEETAEYVKVTAEMDEAVEKEADVPVGRVTQKIMRETGTWVG